MMEIISLIDLLRVQSKAYCDKHAITYFSDGESESDFRTFSGLMDRSQKIGSFLLRYHQPGDVILLPFASSLEFVDAFFGVLYAGMIGVPAPAIRLKRVDSRFKGLMEDAKPAAILQATAQQAKKISELYADDNIPAYSLEDILKEDIEIKAAVHNELAYLQYTSGSTSTPKGVMISQKNVLENCGMIGRYVSIKTEDKVVTWLPHFHDMGLVGGIIVPIFFGMTMYMFPPACFIQKPKRWLSLISKYKATISVAPNFAFDLCEKKISYQELEGVDLSSWRAALNGAEPIMAATVRAFFEKFRPFGLRSSIMCGSYGMAEATLAVSIQAPGKNSYFAFDQAELINGKLVKSGFNEKPDLGQEKILISCGQPDKAIDIKIVDPVTLNLCEPGKIGEIWIRGNSVAQGYWCNPDATRQTFEAKINEDGLTYLRTGDYGGLFDNELFITGRMKDVLIVNGRNYYPQDIELHCCKSDLLITHAKSIVFQSKNGDLVFLQEVSDIKNINYSELSEFIAAIIFDEFELIIKEIIFVFHKTLPHTTSL